MHLPRSARAASATDIDPHIAQITYDSSGGCVHQRFDNKTGRMTRSQEPCELARDSNGIPIPLGTIHRLDAISRAFSGH
jgi:hypothetical protein